MQLLLFAFVFSACFAGTEAHATTSPSEAACKAKMDWTCFDSTVAIVGRSAQNQVLTFCSGVAIDSITVVTAGHCVESLGKPEISQIQIYLDTVVRYNQKPAAIADQSSLRLDRLYNRESSFFHRDRGIVKLSSPLGPLNYPKVQSATAGTIAVGMQLQRIGFGQRRTVGGPSDGLLENRRTWVQSVVHSVFSETLVTEDEFAYPGDSGGPLFLFIPGEGLFYVGVHSTLDVRSGLVYSPRIL